MTSPEQYHAWYGTPRGRWMGESEAALLRGQLRHDPGDRMLDGGTGTGYFARAMSALGGVRVVGLDARRDFLAYARRHAVAGERHVVGRLEALPFPDGAFDVTFSIAALCFLEKPAGAMAELVRVTRRRLAVGLLNRRSLLWRAKGRAGGVGGYRGARWHTCVEGRRVFRGLPVRRVRCRTAVFQPSGSWWARMLERVLPGWLPWGALALLVADVDRAGPSPNVPRQVLAAG